MFEKEAEEYLKKDGTKAEQILNMLNEISLLKITSKQLPFILAMIQQTFQDGAELGYNKANEWHYVADGDLPKTKKRVLVLLKDVEEPILDYYRQDGLWNYALEKEVIAWKEIVLPKESK